jgi:chromosome segregation ATPase
MTPHSATSTAAFLTATVFACLAYVVVPVRASAATEASVSKRDLREARTALQEGRWDDSRAVYEKALESPLAVDPAVRAESLHITTLVMLLSPEDEADDESVSKRLEALSAMRGHPYRLEAAVLETLLDRLSSQRSSYAVLEQQLIDERQAQEDLRVAHTAELTRRNVETEQLRSRNRALRRKTLTQRDEIAALNGAIETGRAEIAQLEADIDFLTEQLAGTHEDQSRMLEAVMGKNEELRKKERELTTMRLALQRQQSELDTQAKELSAKEEEIRTREEAIREVTERILKKDEPGS